MKISYLFVALFLYSFGNCIKCQSLSFISRLQEYPTSSMKSGKEAAAYASCAYSLSEFTNRLYEFPSSEVRSGNEPATYASSNNNLIEFTKRLHEFPSSDIKSGNEPAAYASCSYVLVEFLKRLHEFPSSEIKSGVEPSVYASSNYQLDQFRNRLHEFPSSKIRVGTEPAYYALSNHKLYATDPNVVPNTGKINDVSAANSSNGNSYGSNKTLSDTPDKHQTTTHKGFFYNELPGEAYWSGYVINKKDMVQPSIEKNLFYKDDGIVPLDRKFGKKKFYKDDKLIVKVIDTLSLSLNCNGLKVNAPFLSSYWIGEGEFLISIQIADDMGKEYLKDSWEKVVKTKNKYLEEANTFNETIKIIPEKLQLFPLSQDLYLSFLIQDKKHKKTKLEGFLIFSVE